MLNLSIVILAGNEELHIARCLESLVPLGARQVVVVESQKGDRTHAVAVSYGVTTVWHDWPGLYAKQFNWALDNLRIVSDWVLRLDADEYLTSKTIEKLKEELPRIPEDVDGVTLELRRRFCGGEIRHATNGIRLLRLWRNGKGRLEEREMDEHVVVEGKVVDFDGAFYDDNLNDMDWWREKHRGYAKREARDALAFYRGELTFKPSKAKYYRWPPYFRAIIYFCLRYFVKGGFLDGYAGWMWNFWQGLWYRWIVDREIGRLRRAANDDCEI